MAFIHLCKGFGDIVLFCLDGLIRDVPIKTVRCTLYICSIKVEEYVIFLYDESK